MSNVADDEYLQDKYKKVAYDLMEYLLTREPPLETLRRKYAIPKEDESIGLNCRAAKDD